MSDNPMPPVPLESIRSLFCLDLEEVYSSEFSFEANFNTHQMMTSILRSLDLKKMADQFDEAGANAEKSNYSIGCITTVNGSCFAYSRYKNENGVYHLTFVSSTVEQELDGQEAPSYNIDRHSILTGIETEDAGQRYFSPFGCLCLSIINDNLETKLIAPKNTNAFYASLCYMQQAMATCIQGDDLDLFKNQCWLAPNLTEHAITEFSNIVGATSVEEVTKTYNANQNIIEKLLDDAEEESNGEEYVHYPALKPMLN